MKRAQLNDLRSRSSYPTFRAFIHFMRIVGYFFSGILALVGIAGILKENALLGVGGIVGCIVVFLAAKIASEICFMVADIADSNLEMISSNDPK